MRKRTALFCSGVLAMSIWLSGNTTYAADMPARAIENVRAGGFFDVSENHSENIFPGENKTKGFFTTKYKVSVNKATMRSGPGTRYSSLGILYKNDIVWVRSISNGWAKFKVNSKWHYISASCIKKAV